MYVWVKVCFVCVFVHILVYMIVYAHEFIRVNISLHTHKFI